MASTGPGDERDVGPAPAPMWNTFMFPPRGPRVGLSQAQSEPMLRTIKMNHLPNLREETSLNDTFEDIMQALDEQRAARLKVDIRRKLIENGVAKKEREEQRHLKALRYDAPEPPDWKHPEPGGYFQPPNYERDEPGAFTKNTFLQGMYDCPGIKPPHSDQDNGWLNHRNNDHGEELGLFNEKARHRMHRGELVFAKRLDKKLAKAKILEQQDEERRHGAAKKKAMEENADEFSSLKGTKPHWDCQRTTNHTFFSTPESYLPGDHEYDNDVAMHIVMADRATSSARDFVIGDEQKTSFWKPPPAGTIAGSEAKHKRAQELALPPGVRKIRAEEAKQARAEARRKSKQLENAPWRRPSKINPVDVMRATA